MSTRIIIGTLLIAAILVLVGLDAWVARNAPLTSGLWARGSLIPAIIAFLSGMGCLELVAFFRSAGHAPYGRWALTCCLGMVLGAWIAPAGLLGCRMLTPGYAQFLVMTVALLGAGFIAVFKRDVRAGLFNLAATWLIIGYAGLLPSFLIMLRSDLPGEHGAWVVLTVVLLCKVCDIGAYFVGSAVGRTKLIPAVSPNKTVEGLLGGIAASCAVALLFWWIQSSGDAVPDTAALGAAIRGKLQIATMAFAPLSVAQTLWLGGLIAVLGQVGDLIESIFKRSVGAKDSAVLLPGFGGILDMIDSPLVAAPVAWFLLSVIWPPM